MNLDIEFVAYRLFSSFCRSKLFGLLSPPFSSSLLLITTKVVVPITASSVTIRTESNITFLVQHFFYPVLLDIPVDLP